FLAVLTLLRSAPVFAQQASTGIAANRFVPGVGPLTLVGGEAAEVTARGEVTWALSLTALGDPIRLQNPFAGAIVSRPVRGQLVGDFSVEVGVFRRLAV